MDAPDNSIRFDVPAVVRKWPSLNNARRADTTPYLVIEGTLDECIREFMAKPASTRHLYEIRTEPQPPWVTDTLSAEHVAELARLREFL
ncbi:MAG: hypothetical protein J0H42_25505 [Rhizobiales bacterium]|nr:hypothetical protein [Hyphomicrobiales bacterium]